MLSPAAIIEKKRDGHALDDSEIQYVIESLKDGSFADYQLSAWLMAVFFRGMSLDETVALTRAMVESGEHYDLKGVPGPKIDKHSTGGIGDKVSLILAPLAAACGLRVPMMAGRGLGFSGGTLDKLESIPGFRIDLGRDEFEQQLRDIGCAIIGQTSKIAPADKKLYALRDVTATVECIPLIVASILSKKIAEGTEGLVMDIKVGSGAFMKTKEQARRLAKAIVAVGKRLKLPCRAVLSDMNQPLGYSVGNALEVRECIEILRGEKPDGVSSIDLRELTVQLCAEMLELGRVTRGLPEARKLANAKLSDGSAWQLFLEMVKAQGGDPAVASNPSRLPSAPVKAEWCARKRGHLNSIQNNEIGRILIELGGGRKKASDSIDPAVGLVFHRKLGAKVAPGDPIATVHARAGQDLKDLERAFYQAVEIGGARKPVPKLLVDRM